MEILSLLVSGLISIVLFFSNNRFSLALIVLDQKLKLSVSRSFAAGRCKIFGETLNIGLFRLCELCSIADYTSVSLDI